MKRYEYVEVGLSVVGGRWAVPKQVLQKDTPPAEERLSLGALYRRVSQPGVYAKESYPAQQGTWVEVRHSP